MLVDGVEPGQELPEPVRADRDGQRRADGRVDRVPAAHPVPEAERVRGVDAERRDLVERRGDRDEVLGDGGVARLVVVGLCPSDLPEPRRGPAGRPSVSQGAKVFDATMNSVVVGAEALDGLCEVGGDDVGDEPHLQAALHVRLERLVGQTGPRSEPPMPMLTMVLDPRAGDAGPPPGRTLSANANISCCSAWTSLSMSCPSRRATAKAPCGRRSAVRSTARLGHVDVVAAQHPLRGGPRARPRRPAGAAARGVSSVTRFLDRSTVRSASGRVSRAARPGSAANQPRGRARASTRGRCAPPGGRVRGVYGLRGHGGALLPASPAGHANAGRGRGAAGVRDVGRDGGAHRRGTPVPRDATPAPRPARLWPCPAIPPRPRRADPVVGVRRRAELTDVRALGGVCPGGRGALWCVGPRAGRRAGGCGRRGRPGRGGALPRGRNCSGRAIGARPAVAVAALALGGGDLRAGLTDLAGRREGPLRRRPR